MQIISGFRIQYIERIDVLLDILPSGESAILDLLVYCSELLQLILPFTESPVLWTAYKIERRG